MSVGWRLALTVCVDNRGNGVVVASSVHRRSAFQPSGEPPKRVCPSAEEHCTVVAAGNGREALAILDESKWVGFGCVLMDVQMPEMDGFECTTIIRSKEQVTRVHLPIVAMTAPAMRGDEARCLAAGMDAYLSKPIDPNALFDVVDRQLRFSAAGGELRPTIPRDAAALQPATRD